MKKLWALLFTLCTLSRLCSDISWSTPTTISTMGATASDPHVMIDTNGNATAVWVEGGLIKASSQPAMGSWSASTTLSNTGASAPKLGVDASGNVTAAWIENGIVNTSTLPFGGSWSAETAISSNSGGVTQLTLSIDSTGNAVAVWVRSGLVESARKLAGGSWGLVAQLMATNVSSNPQVGIGGQGTIVAVWHTAVSGVNTLYSATSPMSGSWNSTISVIAVTPAFNHDFPKVGVDANGNATLIWFRYALSNSVYQNVSVLAAQLPNGASAWTAVPTVLIQGGETLNLSSFSLRLAVDPNGDALAFWSMSFDGSTYNVIASALPLGGSWSTPEFLQADTLYAYQVDTAADNTIGAALAVYMVYDGVSSVNIQSQEINITSPSSTWGFSQVFSQGMDNGYPKVASSINGETINAAAVWINNNGVSNVIMASTGSETTTMPPTGLSVTQSSNNFGVFTDYYNTLSWTPSTSPNVARQNIYRDGVFVAPLDPDTTQFLDHNASQSGSVTYGIVAEAQGSDSPMATIVFSP